MSQRDVYSPVNEMFTIEAMPHRTTERTIDRAIRLWLATPPQPPETKATLASFARAMGVKPQDVNNWKERGMPSEWDARAAKVLGISLDMLVFGEELSGLDVKLSIVDNPDAGGGSRPEPPGQNTGPKTPVWRLRVSEMVRATARGRIETMEADRDGLGFVEVHGSPEGLIAIRVRGDGLAPSIDDGRVLIIEPGAQCEPDEWILLELQSGVRMVKKLLIRKPDSIVVSDLATREQNTIEFGQIASMEAIIAVYSANRWRPGSGSGGLVHRPGAEAVRGTSVLGELDEAPTPSKKAGDA